MINEERVKHMTRMAIYEKKYGAEIQPMLKYSKKDYVGLHGLGSFVAGTIFVCVVYGAIVAAVLAAYIENLSTTLIMLLGLIGVLSYSVYIIIHVFLSRRRATRIYNRGRKRIKELSGAYSILEELYDDEEMDKAPVGERDLSEEF